mmetsp:Transcript_85950/g.221289  ORF Transcript_85950/g.221289 Transcript_85950/m.221289 type:complete len:231 (+) Transcript_85950:1283-1975(+)
MSSEPSPAVEKSIAVSGLLGPHVVTLPLGTRRPKARCSCLRSGSEKVWSTNSPTTSPTLPARPSKTPSARPWPTPRSSCSSVSVCGTRGRMKSMGSSAGDEPPSVWHRRPRRASRPDVALQTQPAEREDGEVPSTPPAAFRHTEMFCTLRRFAMSPTRAFMVILVGLTTKCSRGKVLVWKTPTCAYVTSTLAHSSLSLPCFARVLLCRPCVSLCLSWAFLCSCCSSCGSK